MRCKRQHQCIWHVQDGIDSTACKQPLTPTVTTRLRLQCCTCVAGSLRQRPVARRSPLPPLPNSCNIGPWTAGLNEQSVKPHHLALIPSHKETLPLAETSCDTGHIGGCLIVCCYTLLQHLISDNDFHTTMPRDPLIGLVGKPSSGKSTTLNSLTDTIAKVGAHPRARSLPPQY